MESTSTMYLCERCRELDFDVLASTRGLDFATLSAVKSTSTSCSLCSMVYSAITSCCSRHQPGTSSGFDNSFWVSNSFMNWNYVSKDQSTDQWVVGEPVVEQPSTEEVIRIWAQPSSLCSTSNKSSEEPRPKLSGLLVACADSKRLDKTPVGKLSRFSMPEDILGNAMDSLLMPDYFGMANHICQTTVRLSAWEGSSMIPHLATTSVRMSEPDSEEHYSRISAWIRSCTEGHEACRLHQSSADFLPSRLLDVSDVKRPVLIETTKDKDHMPPESYIALSYCWGPGPFPYVTTPDNLAERLKSGIIASDLPRTIRDAIRITQKIGIKYIWIDALCILQGSHPDARADWTHESQTMQDVYHNAYLTLAAAHALDADEGILVGSYTESARGLELTLRSASNIALNGTVRAGDENFKDAMDEPLYHRAWTLQERLLSRRMLIYCRDQIAWECQAAQHTESGKAMKSLGQMRLPDRDHAQDIDKEELADRWRIVVTDYSARNMSVSGDKLPAIAGLAKVFGEMLGVEDEYYAGLWKSGLLDDILWAHRSIDFGHRVEKSIVSEYRAPSWSWAAVDGNVRWPGRGRKGSTTPSQAYAEVIDCNVQCRGSSQYGEVSEAALKLRGPLKNASAYRHCQATGRSWKGYAIPFAEPKKRKFEEPEDASRSYFELYLDGDDEDDLTSLNTRPKGSVTDLEGCWFLRVKGQMSLVLRRCEGPSCGDLDGRESDGVLPFRRIGVAVHFSKLRLDENCDQWYENSEIITVTII